MKKTFKQSIKISVIKKLRFSRRYIFTGIGICIVLFVLVFLGGYSSILSHKSIPQSQPQKQEKRVSKGQVIVSAQKSVRFPLAHQNLKVPILMFHHIRDPRSVNDRIQKNLSVSPAKFKIDLEWLRGHGYQPYSIDDLTGILSGQIVVSKKPVILTFDDGYEDNYQAAFQNLKALSMVGNFYIITGAVDKPNYMTSGQLKEMSREGMVIGSHTISHLDLARASLSHQVRELTDSKEFLMNLLNKDIDDFCYPSGKYNSLTLMIESSRGYKTAVTENSGFATAAFNPLQLPRLRITEMTNFSRLLP